MVNRWQNILGEANLALVLHGVEEAFIGIGMSKSLGGPKAFKV